MRAIIRSFCVIVLVLTSAGQPIDASAEMPLGTTIPVYSPLPGQITWHHSLASGWNESRRTGRPMVIFVTASRCRYCDAMKSGTWRDQGIESRVENEFVAVQLSPEENSDELSRVHIQMYPTTIVALPEGKVVDYREGYQPTSLLHGLLDRIPRR